MEEENPSLETQENVVLEVETTITKLQLEKFVNDNKIIIMPN